jgi:hypothetical protein
MLKIDTIFLFLFIFSLISLLRIFLIFLSMIKQDSPERLKLNKKEIIYNMILFSYFFTYIIQKI